MEEIMKTFTLVLVIGLLFAAAASAFQPGELVVVSKFCSSVEATKEFLFNRGKCLQANNPFPCVIVKNHEVYKGWQITSCRPFGKHPPVIFSYHRAKEIST